MARSLNTLSPVVSVSKPRISSGTWRYFFATPLLFQPLVTYANCVNRRNHYIHSQRQAAFVFFFVGQLKGSGHGVSWQKWWRAAARRDGESSGRRNGAVDESIIEGPFGFHEVVERFTIAQFNLQRRPISC